MRFNKLIEYTLLLCLFIATIVSGYIFVVSIIFKQTTYAGLYNSWQFPMLLAIFIDSAFHKHLYRLSNI